MLTFSRKTLTYADVWQEDAGDVKHAKHAPAGALSNGAGMQATALLT
jgi:hypothetical protein